MSLTIDPDLVIIDTREFIIRFDGSYMPDFGSGIGITLGYRDSPTHIATFRFLLKLLMHRKMRFWDPR